MAFWFTIEVELKYIVWNVLLWFLLHSIDILASYFCRNLTEIQFDELVSLLTLLLSVDINSFFNDRFLFWPDPSREFSCNSYFKHNFCFFQTCTYDVSCDFMQSTRPHILPVSLMRYLCKIYLEMMSDFFFLYQLCLVNLV